MEPCKWEKEIIDTKEDVAVLKQRTGEMEKKWERIDSLALKIGLNTVTTVITLVIVLIGVVLILLRWKGVPVPVP